MEALHCCLRPLTFVLMRLVALAYLERAEFVWGCGDLGKSWFWLDPLVPWHRIVALSILPVVRLDACAAESSDSFIWLSMSDRRVA